MGVSLSCQRLHFSREQIGEDTLSGFFFYYFFGVFRYAAGHTLPVEEGLAPDTGQFGYAGHELDPHPVGKSVEIVV